MAAITPASPATARSMRIFAISFWVGIILVIGIGVSLVGNWWVTNERQQRASAALASADKNAVLLQAVCRADIVRDSQTASTAEQMRATFLKYRTQLPDGFVNDMQRILAERARSIKDFDRRNCTVKSL